MLIDNGTKCEPGDVRVYPQSREAGRGCLVSTPARNPVVPGSSRDYRWVLGFPAEGAGTARGYARILNADGADLRLTITHNPDVGSTTFNTSSRGRWNGCSCGAREMPDGSLSANACASCRFDNE